MLLKIREKSRGIIAYFIVGLIALAFSMWGMDSLFTAMRGDPNEVAKVNGESISQIQVDRVAQQQMRQLMQSGRIDPDLVDMNQLRQFALSQLIQEELLRQETQQRGMRITDTQLDRQLVQFDVFHNEQGRFDREIYTQRLRQQGLSASEFRTQLREDLLNQQLLLGVADSEFVLDQELTSFQRLVGQKRSYRYLIFQPSDFYDQVEVSAAEVEDFYQQNQQRFMAAEQVRVDYLIFDPASLADRFEVSEQELEEEYQRFAASQAGEANYAAAHLLLTYETTAEQDQARQTLEQVREEVLQGADFASLVAELSEDTSTARRGGELGFIEAGTLDPAFEEALFALEEPGDLAIAETPFGLHLIQLTELEQASVPDFDELREDLRERLLAQPLRAATSDLLEELSNLSFSSDDLSEVAAAVDLPMQTSDWLVINGLEGFWAEAGVRSALFSEEVVKEGWITEPLRLDDGRYLVIAKNEHRPQQVRALAEVSDEVRQELKRDLAQDKARFEAEQRQQQLQAGEAESLAWVEVAEQARSSRAVDPEINRAAFALGQDEQASEIVSLGSGQVALIQLLGVEEGAVSEDANELKQLRIMLTDDRGNRMQSLLVQHLQRQAEISFND